MVNTEKKPLNILYGPHDKLQTNIAVPLMIQHILVLSMDLMLPVLMISMISGSREVAQNFVSIMMIGMGIGTILQTLQKNAIGSGYFCAEETGFLYFQASTLAVQTGGLSLLFGMTIIAGFFQMVLSKIIPRIRFLFPTEVAGLMVAMTGISSIVPGVSMMFGINSTNSTMDITTTLIGLTTLLIMVSLSIWGKAAMQNYSIFVGMVLGYILSYFFGILTVNDIRQFIDAPIMTIPSLHLEWSFDIRLLLPFGVAAICSTLKTMGNLALCQKTNNANWKHVDINNVGKGIFAEGVGTSLCGMIGCMGLNSSSSSVGLSMVTGVTSRHLSYLIGCIFIAMAFFPKIAALLAIMPAPVMGAVLLINLGYFIIEGFRIITSRMLDQRKIFVIGLSMVLGLSIDMLPNVYAQFPLQIQPLFQSSLTAVSLTAILLNLLFRIGIKQKQHLKLTLGADSAETVIHFMETSGAAWGARDEIIHRASSAIIEFTETAAQLELVKETIINIQVSFDEYNLDVRLAYLGTLMEFPEKRPTEDELLNDDNALIKLSGFLMRKYSDKINSYASGENCMLHFHFEH